MAIKILAADHHRNGVGGVGFTVALFTDSEEPGRVFLGVSFEDFEQPNIEHQNRGCVAVLDVAEAANGNIFMHPTATREGGNAWRGADYYSATMQEAKAQHSAELDANLARVLAKKDNR